MRVLLLAVLLSGCAALYIRPDDSASATAGKIAARVALAPLTVGASEHVYACVREREPDAEVWDRCRARTAETIVAVGELALLGLYVAQGFLPR